MRNFINIVESKASPAERYIEKMQEFERGLPSSFRASLDAEDDYDVSIQRIYTEPFSRKEGYASTFMKEACRLASKMGITLFLEALPDDDEGDDQDNISLEDLVNFYRRFGFEGDIRNDSAMMFRNPRRKK